MEKAVKIQTCRIQELLQCAKPLIFENREAEWRYSMLGTCFMARFRSRYYAITAKHCLHNRANDSVRVRLNPGELKFLPVVALAPPKDNGEDFSDFAFFQIEPDLLPPAALRSKHFLDLDHHNERSVNNKEILAVVGYPSERNTADYDSFVINTEAFSGDGRYDGPAEGKHCSRIRFNNLAPIEDLDGLSGSPVLAFYEVREKTYTHQFAGVLIQATKKSGMGTFINSSIVIEFLKRLSATKRLPSDA